MKLPDCVNPFHKDNKRKEILFGAFLVLSFFIFHSYFENSFNEAFLEAGEGEKTPVMRRLIECITQHPRLSTCAFVLVVFLMGANFFDSWRKRVISGDYLWILSFVAFVYGFYRFKGFGVWDVDVWDFVPIHAPFFVYTDLVLFFILFDFLAAFCIWRCKYINKINKLSLLFHRLVKLKKIKLCIFAVLKLFVSNKKDNFIKASGFVADGPLDEENSEDKFGYTTYAKNIAQRIIDTPKFKHSFAIGINGKWGSGKSSFMYLVHEELKNRVERDIIEVKFNPWRSESSAAIIKDFFEEFQQALRPYSSRTGSLLQEYSDKLVEADKTDVLKLLKLGKELIWHGQSKESLFEEIKDIIEKIDRKIIVYIDDLDRLDTKETVEVLKLVRNTANFPNTFFVVAYDREYVISAIHEINPHNKEFFLEKIFQLEVNLPLIGKEKILEILRIKLSEVLDKTEGEEIMNTDSYLLTELLENGRDVVRIVNSLLLNYKNLKGEVAIQELFLLEVLRFKYPRIYEDFRNYKKEYIYERNAKYKLKEEEIEHNRFGEIESSVSFPLPITDKYVKSLLPEKDAEKILNLFKDLFSVKKNNELSIRNPSMFDKYFTYAVGEKSFSVIEFIDARGKGESDLMGQIDRVIELGLNQDLADYFERQLIFKGNKDFKYMAYSLFYFINMNKNSNSIYLLPIVYRYFCYFDDKGVSYKEMKDTLSDIFHMSVYSKLNPVIIHYVQTYGEDELKSDGFVLSKTELEVFSIKYLEEVLKEADEWSGDIVNLYSNCRQTKDIVGDEKNKTKEVYPSEAKWLVIDFIKERGLEGFLKYILGKHYDNNSYKQIYRMNYNPLEAQLFSNWKDFEEFINEQDEEKFPYLIEFKALFQRFKENGYKSFPVAPPNPA